MEKSSYLKIKLSSLQISLLGLALFSIFYFYNAWICEDAFISFRVVDNFLSGFGLRWNIHERVQVYTHPLWLFLLIALQFLVRNLFLSASLLCISFSLAILVFMRKRFLSGKKNTLRYFTMILLLIASRAAMDYLSSGLENSLGAFLMVYLLWLISQSSEENFGLKLGMISSLLYLTRPDLILFIVPNSTLFLISTFQSKNWSSLKKYLRGLSLFFIWEIFSLVYYGLPFPNTYYAKINTRIDSWKLFKNGLDYFLNALKFDTLTLAMVIGVSLWCAFDKSLKKYRPLALGSSLYLLYLFKIGGDYMSGRFFLIPFVLAVGIFVTKAKRDWIIAGGLMALGVLIVSPWAPSRYLFNSMPVAAHGPRYIADEKHFVMPWNSLRKFKLGDVYPDSEASHLGLKIKRENQVGGIVPAVGIICYFAGPKPRFVDPLAITDAFLARFPVSPFWQVGHYQRAIPEGYLESVLSDTNRVKDPHLHELYEMVQEVTRGDLFSKRRYWAMIDLNSGKDEELILEWAKSEARKAKTK